MLRMLESSAPYSLFFFVVSCAILGFFVYHARKIQNFERVHSIMAEFCAVLAAISLGLWLSATERRDERKEVAINLLSGAESFSRAVSELRGFERYEITIKNEITHPFPSPNIFDALFSSSDFYEFSTPRQVQFLAQAVVEFRRSGVENEIYDCHINDPDHITRCLTPAQFKSNALRLAEYFCVVRIDIQIGEKLIDKLMMDHGGNYSDSSYSLFASREEFSSCFQTFR